jgi:tellurite resistance protein
MSDAFEKESRTLERAFYAGANAPLLAELRVRSEAEQERERLGDVVGIKDESFLRRLATLGVRPEAAVAVTLVPLVLVAWADGSLDERERSAILDAARERGMAAQRIAAELLRNSLSQAPDPKLFATWTAYVRRLWGRFPEGERWQMRENLLRSAREVAEAAGGFLGLAAISAGERRVLAELEAVLD